jgi:hypothetical protein
MQHNYCCFFICVACHTRLSCATILYVVYSVLHVPLKQYWVLRSTRHVQKVSSDHAYQPCKWRERGAPARWCLTSRDGYIRHIVSSHSLFISLTFCLEMSMKIKNPASCKIRSVIKFFMLKCLPGWNLLAGLWSLWRKCYEWWNDEKMV